MGELVPAWRLHFARATRPRVVRARDLVCDLIEGRPKVLYLPPPRGRLAWWGRPGSAAHLAVWLPNPEQPGHWRWHLLCRHSRKRVGYWWAARDGERRCRTCEQLIERARSTTTGRAA